MPKVLTVTLLVPRLLPSAVAPFRPSENDAVPQRFGISNVLNLWGHKRLGAQSTHLCRDCEKVK